MEDPTKQVAAKTGLLIRRPVAQVFEAFINPDMTTQFWFTHSSGKLETGKQITWTWQMYNVNVSVFVKAIELHKSIVIEWGNNQQISTVEWTFKDLGDKGTYVSIVNSGFQGNSNELIEKISDSTKGFTFVLAGLKALLEHGIRLNLVADAFVNE